MTMAGPAPGRSGSPTIAVPVVAKMPAPIVAPTPSAVRCHLLSERLRPPRSRMSSSQSRIDFRTKSRLIVPRRRGPTLSSGAATGTRRVEWSGSGLGAALPRQGEGNLGCSRNLTTVRSSCWGEAKRAHDFVELLGVFPVPDLRDHLVALDPAVHPNPERHAEGYPSKLLGWVVEGKCHVPRLGRAGSPPSGSRAGVGAVPLPDSASRRTRSATRSIPCDARSCCRAFRFGYSSVDDLRGRRHRRHGRGFSRGDHFGRPILGWRGCLCDRLLLGRERRQRNIRHPVTPATAPCVAAPPQCGI